MSGNTLFWSTGSGGQLVPKPTSALAGLLLGAGGEEILNFEFRILNFGF
jgi:hypothetical protein